MVEDPQVDATAWVEAWSQEQPLLLAIQRLVYLSAESRPAIARRLGLGPTDLNLLEHLVDGPLGPTDLSRRIGVTPAATTIAIQRMEERGHLARDADPEDRRRTSLVLTPSAREELFGQLLPMFQALQEAIDDLSSDQEMVVRAFIERVSAAIGLAVDGTASSPPDGPPITGSRPARP